LEKYFGQARAYDLYHLCRGQDNREVVTRWERKSWTSEETFNKDVTSLQEAQKALKEIYQDWRQRFETSSSAAELRQKIRGAVVKLKYTDFKTTTCEHSLRHFPELADFSKLLEQAWARRGEAIRLLGLGVRLGSLETETRSRMAKDDNQLAFW
jgi:DNA polymerase-4